MVLMPHTKILQENIESLVKNIVVKRPDVPFQNNLNETVEGSETAYAYKIYKEGTDDLYTYRFVNADVLKSMVGWVRLTSSVSKPLPNVCDKTLSDGTVIHSDYRYPTNNDQLSSGTIWINKLGTERYSPIVSFSENKVKVSCGITIGSTHYDVFPDMEYIDTNNNAKVFPYFAYKFVTDEEASSPVYDDYHNQMVRLGTDTFAKDDIKYCYYQTASSTEKLYQLFYSTGFYFGHPIVLQNSAYINTNEYDIENQTYARTDECVYVYDSARNKYWNMYDRYCPVEIYHDTPRFYRCCIIQRYADTTDTIKVGSNTAVLDTPTVSSTAYSYEFYYDFSDTGNYEPTNADFTIFHYKYHGGLKRVIINTNDGIDRYTKSGNVFIPDDNGNYTFICSDCRYYLANSSSSDIKTINDLHDSMKGAALTLMRKYVVDTYCPEVDSHEYSVPLYRGEENDYYRMLNGLPPKSEIDTSPKVDRKLVNPKYDGDNINPYVWELTDAEVEKYISLGYMDTTKRIYPNAKYLDYIGTNRVDVLKSRYAAPFDIIRLGDCNDKSIRDRFLVSYEKSRQYIIHKYYHQEIFGDNNNYLTFIAFLILGTAISNIMSESSEVLIQDKYSDTATMNNIIESFGYINKFKDVPDVYKKGIAKNIQKLIRNRGTNSIYKTIFEILGITNNNIFGFDIVNADGDLSVLKYPINDSSSVEVESFDDLIEDDDEWKADKETVENTNFTVSGTKYIEADAYFDLAQITINNSYLMNYLLEDGFEKNVSIEIPEIGKISIVNIVIALFAIESAKYGFNGFIPSTTESVAAICKYRLPSNNLSFNDVRKEDNIFNSNDDHYNWDVNSNGVVVSGSGLLMWKIRVTPNTVYRLTYDTRNDTQGLCSVYGFSTEPQLGSTITETIYDVSGQHLHNFRFKTGLTSCWILVKNFSTSANHQYCDPKDIWTNMYIGEDDSEFTPGVITNDPIKYDNTKIYAVDKLNSIINKYSSSIYGEGKVRLNTIKSEISENIIPLSDASVNSTKRMVDNFNKASSNDSFISHIKTFMDSANSIEELNCYNELLDCIEVSDLVKSNFRLNSPIWEPIFIGRYQGNLSPYSASNYTHKIWNYFDDISKRYCDLLKIDNLSKSDNILFDVNPLSMTSGRMPLKVYLGTELPSNTISTFRKRKDIFYNQIIDNYNGTYRVSIYLWENNIWKHVMSAIYNGKIDDYDSDNYESVSWTPPYTAISNPINNIPNILNTNPWVSGLITNSFYYNGTYTANVFYGSCETRDVFDIVDNDYVNICINVSKVDSSNARTVVVYQRCDIGITYMMYLRNNCSEIFNSINTITANNSRFILNIFDSLIPIDPDDNLNGVSIIPGTNVDIKFNNDETTSIINKDGIEVKISNDGETINKIMMPNGSDLSYSEYYNAIRSNIISLEDNIILSVENAISDGSMKDKYILNDNGSDLAIKYLSLLIDTFKAYTASLRKVNINFKYNSEEERIRLLDTISIFASMIRLEDEINIIDSIIVEKHINSALPHITTLGSEYYVSDAESHQEEDRIILV